MDLDREATGEDGNSGGAPAALEPAAAPAAAPSPETPTASEGRRRRLTAGGGRSAVIALVMVALFAGGVVVGRWTTEIAPTTGSPSSPGSSAYELALIDQAWGLLHQNYVAVKELDDQALAYAAIQAMTQAVGDVGHTSFLTAEQARAQDESLSGTLVGIGIQLNVSDATGATVVSVFPTTPAAAAGLLPGDQIVAVDSKATAGLSIDQVATEIRGPVGEPVTLTIARSGTKNFDVAIVRRQFEVPLVSWAMVPGRTIAFIRIEQLATGATKELKVAIAAAKQAGATGVILDLRGDPGGYVSEATGVASEFVGSGVAYRSVDASGKEREVPVESGGSWTTGLLVVLTDGGTASGAEIVTGAIQDAGRGTVVGEKTFGTGTVLSRFGLADGSALEIGVQRWLTPAGRPIWHTGLDPDVVVSIAANAVVTHPDDVRSLTAVEVAKAADAQVRRALELLAAKT